MVNNPRCNAGDEGLISGWGTKISQAAEQLSLGEKLLSRALWSPCATTRKPAAAAAAAKSLQSCLTLCDPTDCSPPGSPIPGILQARTLEWVAISFSNA